MNANNNIHEMKIKVTCARWLEARHRAAASGTLINEFSANRSKARADLVFVSRTEITAVEIKSSQDNINRLEGQLIHLRKLYNRVEVVTTIKHLERAKIACSKMSVGLHLVDGEDIVTVLKGRRRSIDPHFLKHRLFPKNIQERKGFQATEIFYRDFLLKKYAPVDRSKFIDGEFSFIKSLNPHYIRRVEARQRREAYHKGLEDLSAALQSTQSSSSS
jgi:hypothetical protein